MIMKLQTYTSTPGLDRYPKPERFAKWQSTHKQLLRDDIEYRKRFRMYCITLFCLSTPLLAVYGFYFGIGLTSFAVNLAIICFSVVAICYAASRQMHFMNLRIGQQLQSEF